MLFNAQIVNSVNAYSGNEPLHSCGVTRQPESEPCDFWKRLTEAWKAKGLRTSQNGVAIKLRMSQGSTRRWFLGEGLPETETIREIARLGNVTIDWLLVGTHPKYPVQKGSALDQFLEIWDQLEQEDKDHVLKAAEGQLARRIGSASASTPTKSSGRRVA